MIKLYSKDVPAGAVTAMKKRGRFPHAVILTGGKGAGKSFMADYIAMTLLCENSAGGVPCGECRQCRRISEGTHPDVIKPERSGKKQIYNRETIRGICSDAFVRPNDRDAKVYIFRDCRGIEEGTQNLMLKLIEEPPDTAYFIFTAENAGVFLPTIRSRAVTLGVPECSEEDCEAALLDMGYAAERAEEAVQRFHGNIGLCRDYLEGGETAVLAELCHGVTAALAAGDEYGLLAALRKIGDDRDRVRTVLEMTDMVIRDALAYRCGVPLIGCDPEGAKQLSARLSLRRGELIHEAVLRLSGHCGLNMNVQSETAAFVCAVMG